MQGVSLMKNQEIELDVKQKKLLQSQIKDISARMTQIDGIKDGIKDDVDGISEATEIPKAKINKLIRMYHKMQADEEFNNAAKLHQLYFEIFPSDSEEK